MNEIAVNRRQQRLGFDSVVYIKLHLIVVSIGCHMTTINMMTAGNEEQGRKKDCGASLFAHDDNNRENNSKPKGIPQSPPSPLEDSHSPSHEPSSTDVPKLQKNVSVEDEEEPAGQSTTSSPTFPTNSVTPPQGGMSSADTPQLSLEMEESSSSTRTSEGSKIPRSVSFGTLHVREFPVAMGDNPSVQSGGPPIRLEYKIQQEEYIVPVHEYEEQRDERRKQAELRVPASLRRDWVGHDPTVEQQVALQRRQRSHSVAMHEWDDWHYTMERVMRGVSKRFRKKKPDVSPADQWCRQYEKERKAPT